MIINKKAKLLTLLVVIVIICVATLAFKSMITFLIPMSKSEIENDFLGNKDIILSVKDYLQDGSYSYAYIPWNYVKGEMKASINDNGGLESVKISNVSIAENITSLIEQHSYKCITKEKNWIYFQRWQNLKYGRGVVYSINGEPPQDKLITKLEPLKENNWYFYETE